MKVFIIQKYGAISDIAQVEIDDPTIGRDEVLVRVKSAAINPADIKVITGKNGGKFIHSGKSPIALGFDYSGVIEEAGVEVSGFRQGDEVFGFLPYSTKTTQGSFADYVVVKSGTIAKKTILNFSYAGSNSCHHGQHRPAGSCQYRWNKSWPKNIGKRCFRGSRKLCSADSQELRS